MKKSVFMRLTIIVAAFLVGISAFAQKVTVSGTVSDPSGQPVIGAAIFEKGTTNGTSTDVDGKYTIAVKSGATLVYSCIGYAETTRTAVAGTIDVTLADDTTLLEETVVIGYGVQKKSDVTGAIASVGKDALENRSVNDVSGVLAGKTSGVQVISSNGRPGEVGTIRVRGLSSNNSGAAGPLYIVDGLQISSLSNVDPATIKSIEVLKDAASAAIYGAQAGNGVVLITTKTGAKGQGKIFYDGSYTIENLGYHPKMMNATQYIDYMLKAAQTTQTYIDEYYDGKTDTDWFKECFPGGSAMRHTVGAQGGNDRGTYYTAISILDHDGILYGDRDTYKRLNFALNADYKIKEWLKIGSTNNFTMRTTKTMDSPYGSEDSICARIYSMDPLTPFSLTESQMTDEMKIAKENGENLMTLPNGDYLSATYFVNRSAHPLFGVYRSTESYTKNFNLNGTMYANLTPVKGLTVTSRLGYTFWLTDNFNYTEPYWLSTVLHDNKYYMYNKMQYGLSYQWENFANYSHTFAKKHNLDAMVGMQYRQSNGAWLEAYGDKMIDTAKNFRYMSYIHDEATDQIAGTTTESASIAYFGRLGYNFDNRYFIQATFRADAFDSSYLSATNRWGYFPSVSVGWNVTNEPWMRNVNKDILSFLKIRASYGTNGNISSLGSSYKYDATVGVGASNYQMGTGTETTLATYPTSASNASLKWETSVQQDFGIDARFFRDRLSLGLDLYNKDTDGLLVSVTPSATTGQSSVYVNSGDVNNKGIELELSWKDSIGDFNYSISGNIAHNKNKVTYLDPAIPYINSSVRVSNNFYASRFQEGYPAWYFIGYKFTGVDPATGDPMFEDVDGVEGITEDDLQKIGDPNPDFTYGITFTAEWKGIDFTLFGSGSQGNDIWFARLRSDAQDRNLPAVFYTDAWQKAGDNARYPRYGQMVATQYYRSSGCVYDGSYFRINQMQLGYTLPKKLTEKALISNLRLYVSLDDFFTFSKYIGFDPVTASVNTGDGMGIDMGTYPSAKKVMFGINVSF